MNKNHCIKCDKPVDESACQTVDVVASDVTNVRLSNTQVRSTYRNIIPLHILICYPCFLKLRKHILRLSPLFGGLIALIGYGVMLLADRDILSFYWILILMLLIFPTLFFFVIRTKLKPGSQQLKGYLKTYLRKDIEKKIRQQYRETDITLEGHLEIHLSDEFEALMKSGVVTRSTTIRSKKER